MTVLVIGAGLIGCAIAWRLSQQGARVTLVDRPTLQGKASIAGAGMLAPLAEAIQPGPQLDFAVTSLRMYPNFVQELQEQTGINVGLRTDGILRVAWDDEEATLLKERFESQQSTGFSLTMLQGEELWAFEPSLSHSITMGVYSPQEAHLHTEGLLKALLRACHMSGVQVLIDFPAVGLLASGHRVKGAKLADGTAIGAEVTVVAAGAWSGHILSSVGIDLPVQPIKGQIVHTYAPHLPLRTVIFSHRGYVVPRDDGSILLGATEELAGFRPEATVAGVHQLLSAGLQLIPALAQAQLKAVRAGFRPALPNRVPIIGTPPGLEGLIVATGHYRNGILLTPATAAAVADLALKGRSGLDITAFSPAQAIHSSRPGS